MYLHYIFHKSFGDPGVEKWLCLDRVDFGVDFDDSWIQSGSARVGLKSRPGVDFISTGSAVQNRTYAQCLINT